MADSSVNSRFRFISYKIDYLKYEMKKSIELLELQRNLNPSLWKYEIAIRQPLYVERKKCYICGLNSKVFLFSPKTEEDNKNQKKALLFVEAGIAGIFTVMNKEGYTTEQASRLEKEIEDNLVRVQMPAILMPYLRGAVTSFLANAGFGAVIFPLINVQELAKKALANVDIKVL